MDDETGALASEWGAFVRETASPTEAGVLYARHGDPELVLQASDTSDAAGLLPRLSAFFDDRRSRHRRATDAVVTRFSDEEPDPAELDAAEHDLVLETVEVLPGGELVLHLDDSCGLHVMHGHRPAVRVDIGGTVVEVMVEA